MTQNLIDKKIEYWEHQLLDLGKRNRMINYRETKRTTIKLTEPSFGDLYKRIAVNEEILTFQRAVDRETDVRVFSILSLLENLSVSLPVTIGDIKTEGSYIERQRTLKNLRAKSRLALEEQGTNILYLSFGFIEWREGKGASARLIKSPLILVPAVLTLESLNSPYTIKKHEDDIVVNPTLEYYLKTEYGIDLPHFDSDRETLEEYLTRLEAIADKRGWRILREVSLGLLSFLKITMYNDLMRNKDRIKENPVIRAMAGDTEKVNNIPENLQNYDLDSIDPKDCYQVMPADSSQQEAVLYSKNNVSFVMEGPPGSGKSQTITNMIAEALAQGKTVLFVSEKMAALQVVYRRLQDADLGDFCLPLHSYKANKREILEQLGKNLKLKALRIRDSALTDLEELSAIRRELNRYAAELHELTPSLNLSCYEVYGKLEEVKDAPSLIFTLSDPLETTQSGLQAYLNALKEYSLSLTALEGFIKNNPWNGLTSRAPSREFTEKMRTELGFLTERLASVIRALSSVAECPELEKTLKYSDLPAFADALAQIGMLPDVPDTWRNGLDVRDIITSARAAKELYNTLFSLRESIETVFTKDIYGYDCNAWKKVMLSSARSITEMPLLPEKNSDYYLRNSAALIKNFSELESCLRTAENAFRSINGILGTDFSANTYNLQLLSELISLTENNVILQQSWFGSDTGKLKKLVSEAEKTANKLKTAAEQILTEWEEDILSIDYSPILSRYKTDYNGILKVFNPQYRRDQKQLLALSKNVRKKLPDSVAVDLLKSLKTYHDSLKWFSKNETELFNALSGYYNGADSDWDYISAALGIAESLANLPADSLTPEFIRLLSADHKVQHEHLKKLLDTAVSALSAAKTAVIGNGLTADLDSPAFSSVKTAETANSYVTKLKALSAHNALLKPYLKTDCGQIDTVYSAIEKLNEHNGTAQRISALSDEHARLFGSLFNGEATDWDRIIELLERTDGIKKCRFYSILRPVFDLSEERKRELTDAAEQIKNVFESSKLSLSRLAEQFAPETVLENAEISALYEKIRACSSGIDMMGKWIDYLEAKEACEKAGLSDFIIRIEQRELTADIENAFLKGFYYSWLGAVCEKAEAIRRFRKNSHNEKIEKFTLLDDKQLIINSARIREKLIGNLPSAHRLLKATDEVAILNKELNKKRNIMPLRKLFRNIPNLLMKLKPCLMMSPLSVSYFLETEAYHFDLVIFDEASQIFPEDAIGAIFRGSQVIIAGDSKQLPPTNFFASTTNNHDGDYDLSDDDEDAEEIVSDSILEESASVLPNRMLSWHYRSKHESLIAFSNREIYKNSLITFPNTANDIPDMGVEYVYVEDGRYDRGGRKNNVREAEECVRLVFEHIDTHPDRSLGIIAFSESQQSTIENAIIDYRERHPSYEWFFDESRDEPFFVKNLENVQGDERDTIIFSICYGKDKNDAMYMNFGPVVHNGGERRLNVAITRAKCNVKLVGSIMPSDIDLNRASSEGARMLRAYIEYAIRGTAALKPLERNAVSETEDVFCNMIADFIEAHGYKIERRVGCSDYKIDIAVLNPDREGEYIAGIECDGLSYVHAKTARDRDHLRRSVLKKMGWNMYRVWSTEWVRNPFDEERALLDFIRSACEGKGADGIRSTNGGSDADSISLESIAEESTGYAKKSSSTNPYGFEYYKEANWRDAPRRTNTDSISRTADIILHIVGAEQPIHIEMLYKRMGPAFAEGRATESVKSTIDKALNERLKDRVSMDGERFLRLLPLTPITPRIPQAPHTPRPFEYIHTEEVAAAMTAIINNSFGITEDDLASECVRVFGYERKGPKIKAKTDEAIKYLSDDGMIRIIDGKIQYTGGHQ